MCSGMARPERRQQTHGTTETLNTESDVFKGNFEGLPVSGSDLHISDVSF